MIILMMMTKSEGEKWRRRVKGERRRTIHVVSCFWFDEDLTEGAFSFSGDHDDDYGDGDHHDVASKEIAKVPSMRTFLSLVVCIAFVGTICTLFDTVVFL